MKNEKNERFTESHFNYRQTDICLHEDDRVKNTEKLYDYVIFMGRFEPFHNAHKKISLVGIEKLKKTKNSKIIFLLGSADSPRTTKNPFNTSERKEFILNSLKEYKDKILIGEIKDYLYQENRWIAEVQETVKKLIEYNGDSYAGLKIGIIGRIKDRTSYYLKSFADFEPIEVERGEIMGATELREHYFENTEGGDILLKANVPGPVYEVLKAFKNTPFYKNLTSEYKFLIEYKKQWDGSPYPPLFVTTDCVVVCSGYVLLIQRKFDPGKNLIALPGGFLNHNQTVFRSAIRELNEETRLNIRKEELENAFRGVEVFDHPDRSLRGRTITHAHLFVLPNKVLPSVKGGDDAFKAKWYPINEVVNMRERFFEDHYSILEKFIFNI